MKIVDDEGTDIRIRTFCIEDYDKLIALWQDAGLPYKPNGRDRRDYIERELKSSAGIFLVAESEGELIGSIFGTHDGRKGWINRLAVAPAYRKTGIAAKLVKEVENRLFDMGIGIIAGLIKDWNTGFIGSISKDGLQASR